MTVRFWFALGFAVASVAATLAAAFPTVATVVTSLAWFVGFLLVVALVLYMRRRAQNDYVEGASYVDA